MTDQQAANILAIVGRAHAILEEKKRQALRELDWASFFRLGEQQRLIKKEAEWRIQNK